MYAGHCTRSKGDKTLIFAGLNSLCILGVLLLTRSAVSANFWFVVPFLAEMGHQSPYRNGVMFPPL